MLRSSRSPFRSSRRRNQKKRPLPWAWIIPIALPLALIGLELLMRAFVGASGKTAELASYQGEPAIVTAYRLNYQNPAGKPYDGIPAGGPLTVKRSSLMGYRLVGNQQSNFWRINEQGFRGDRPLSLEKPKDEVRIFVLGGSTAFGQMSSSNQTTFASKLEARFNQQVAEQKSSPKKFRPTVLPYYADELAKATALPPRIRESQYRVVNAAVPGYASSNELAQLALQVLSYKPDFIVVVDGYADLLLPSDQEGADIPGIESLLENAPNHWMAGVSQQVKNWVYQSYLVRGFQYWVLRPQDSTRFVIPPGTHADVALSDRLAADTTELNRRVSRYRNNLEQIARLTTAAKIPLVVAVQPEITSRNSKTLTPHEKTILAQLGQPYPQRVKAGYEQLQQSIAQFKQAFPKEVVALNLYNAYANVPGEVFQDPIHLTDEANSQLATQLYDTIAKQLLLQPKPYSGSEP